MSFEACGRLVERGDPDRFLAAMSAPVDVRGRLFALYAFNLEVARAPWLTKEQMIAEMRLQWWRDVVEEIAKGGPVRAHEVSQLLTETVVAGGVSTDVLDKMVEARRWDIYRETFDDEAQLWDYLDATGGGLMWASAQALGAQAEQEADIRSVGRASALASWLMAVPELEEKKWSPLPDGRPQAVASIAAQGLEMLTSVKGDFGQANAALRAGWRSATILKQASKEPERVAQGALGGSEFKRKTSLMWKAMRGAW